MPLEDLVKLEDCWNDVFAKREFKFEPKKLLCVTVLRCRDVSVSYLRDKFIDTPDPQFRVSVPSFPEPNIFRTVTKQNQPTSEINETFKFVFPPESSLKQPLLVEVELHDDDILCDDFLGVQTFDFSKFELGKVYKMTLSYDGHGEVDIEAKVIARTEPDFRLGLTLHEEERQFRIRRIPIVYEALKKLIGIGAPRDVAETPVISLCTSGGGYRATVGMAGVMEALHDHGLLDVFTYAAGLSGSGWYLESAYARKGMKKNEQANFHSFLKRAATDNFFTTAFSPSNISSFRHYIKAKKRRGQPTSFVDLFGFTAGSLFLGLEKLNCEMSDLKDYVEDASVPYPLLVSLHVKNNASASKFHAYMECSPHECAFPGYGIGMDCRKFGSVWNSGFIVRDYPETPTHFHLGVTGSGFAISATSNLESGEKEEHLLDYIDKIRVEKQKEKDEFEDEDSDDDETETDSKANDTSTCRDRMWSTLDSIKSIFHRDTPQEPSHHENNHDHEVDFDDEKSDDKPETEKEELMNIVGGDAKQKMSITKKTISLIDAGLYNNTPSVILLRPQRTTDLLIVMDFSAHPSDDAFYNIELFGTAAHAWRDGLRFPTVDFRKIHNLPPTECLVFDDEDDDMCPIVVWFSLAALEFRKLENYQPRSGFKYDKKSPKFNDFKVFGPGSNYGLYTMGYSELVYEQIKELMYFNVSSNIEVIEEAMIKAVAKKRRRLQRTGFCL